MSINADVNHDEAEDMESSMYYSCYGDDDTTPTPTVPASYDSMYLSTTLQTMSPDVSLQGMNALRMQSGLSPHNVEAHQPRHASPTKAFHQQRDPYGIDAANLETQSSDHIEVSSTPQQTDSPTLTMINPANASKLGNNPERTLSTQSNSSPSSIRRERSYTSDGSWFIGARKTGMWMIDYEYKIWCSYTRGKDSRWKDQSIDPETKAMEISCNQLGHSWVVDEPGNVYICVNYTADNANEKTVVNHTTYENQRWWVSPRGWSSNLLPTDRDAWSDESGLVALPKDSFSLPSRRWSWTTEWTIVRGPHTDDDGWQYAQDFHKNYTPAARPGDEARRRAWKRQRRSSSVSPWTQVHAPTTKTGGRMPVVSIGVGTNGLWVVTNTFDVYFRGGIVGGNLEGTAWRTIAAPAVGAGANAMGVVAVGPIAQVWLIAPDGKAYVRKNASVSNPMGTKWQLVKGALLKGVCVGENLVWALDSDGKVLYRLDVTSYRPQGKGWQEIESPSPQSPCVCISTTPNPHLVRCINEAGAVFDRRCVSQAVPHGESWAPLTFGKRMRRLCTEIDQDQMDLPLPPLIKGDWVLKIRNKIAERDRKERNNTNFNHYQAFNDKSHIDKHKRGLLRWYRSGIGIWNATTFILNGETLTYVVDEIEDHELQHGAEVLKIETLGAIHGNCPDESLNEPIELVFKLEFKTRTFVLKAESQREKEGWMLSLLTAHASIPPELKYRANLAVSRPYIPPPIDAIWALDLNGNPWYCERPSFDDDGVKALIWYALKPYVQHGSWGCALGRFVNITSAKGLTWALGADNAAYVSNHHQISSYGEERLTVVNKTITSAWTKVPDSLNAKGEIIELTSISMGAACTWATTRDGDVMVRWGISKECPIGVTWEYIKSDDHNYNRFAFVRICQHTVWGVTMTGMLVTRQGFSSQHPCGTHWTLCSGMILNRFHLDGAIASETPDRSKIASPPLFPRYKTTAVDVTGSKENCMMIDEEQLVKIGEESKEGVVDWTKGEVNPRNFKQVTMDDDSVVMGLSIGGEVYVKNCAHTWKGFRDWTALTSVSAYNPSKALIWSWITQGAGSLLVANPVQEQVLGNGEVLQRPRSKWGHMFQTLLKLPETRLMTFLQNRNIDWRPLRNEVVVGSEVIVYCPSDNYWYHGICVGKKHFDEEFCLLIRFCNAVHIWSKRHLLIPDEPPDATMVHVGLEVLFSTQNWENDVRFASGVVVEVTVVDGIEQYQITSKQARDDDADDATYTCGLAQLRLLRMSSYTNFHEFWKSTEA
eukprot:m.185121 g.185121  ORF g.185121 m.185121 type:complete len:1275 (+) comp32221_c0_seq1:383-4207(+)